MCSARAPERLPHRHVEASGDSSVWLGKLFFGSSTISENRVAEARVDVPPTGNGLRPYALCSTYVPSADSAFPSGITEVDFPSTADTTGTCPTTAATGSPSTAPRGELEQRHARQRYDGRL